MKQKILTGAIMLSVLISSCSNRVLYKEIYELTADDFKNYPVWENCLYNGTAPIINNLNITEVTFTPYTKKQKLNPDGYYLVSTRFKLADSTFYHGYSIYTGTKELPSVKNSQPVILFSNKNPLSFWKGILGRDSLVTTEFYKILNKEKHEVFPIYFETMLHDGQQFSGTIKGFAFCMDFNCDSVEYFR